MIPSWLQAVVLGVVQGLTEFIPVSSSGHLVLVPHLFGWERPGLAFDVALHMGTAGAIVTYFRAELVAMVRGLLGGRGADRVLFRRVALLLVLASVPVAIVGLTLEDVVAEAFDNPLAAAGFLVLTAAILVAGEHWRARRVALAHVGAGARVEGERRPGGDTPSGAADPDAATVDEAPAGPRTADAHVLPLGDDPADPTGRTLDRVGARHALLIGTAQCLALFPGVSRSGTTIMAGVFAGLTRQAATRFSFLLALPALIGAGILALPDLAEPGVYRGWEVALGVTAAFVSSYVAIRFLVAFVSRARLTVFAAYCLVAAAVGFVGSLIVGV